jgi:hypothetical protein
MKLIQISFILLTFVLLNSCKTASTEAYEVFGTNFDEKGAISASELDKILDDLPVSDTVDVVFKTRIHAVCQKKGCWMEVDLADDNVARVTFIDYSFFVPMNAMESEAIVKGKAFWKTDSVAEKMHYAEDAGEEYLEEEEDTYAPHIVATGVKIFK